MFALSKSLGTRRGPDWQFGKKEDRDFGETPVYPTLPCFGLCLFSFSVTRYQLPTLPIHLQWPQAPTHLPYTISSTTNPHTCNSWRFLDSPVSHLSLCLAPESHLPNKHSLILLLWFNYGLHFLKIRIYPCYALPWNLVSWACLKIG